MLKSNIAIQYHGFYPSESTRSFIDSMINEMQDQLPDGAAIRATFTKQHEMIKGMLQVNSYNGPFFSITTAKNLREVTMGLISQMHRRLGRWKSRRHDRKTIRHMEVRPESVTPEP